MAYLSRLSLTNFRSFEELDLTLPQGVVVFFGANAQGKTTLLEAIYLLAIARSFRAENEREVVRFNAVSEGGQALVAGELERGGDRLTVYVGYQAPLRSPVDQTSGSGSGRVSLRKEIRVNRVRRTAAELVGNVNAVLFTAEDLHLVFGPPSGRRRYLNILISQSDPTYLKTLQRYQRVVQQRNQLLRMLKDGRAKADEMAFWDDELVREGASLVWRRGETLRELGPLCEERHRFLSGAAEDLLVEYRPSVPPGEDIAATESTFRDCLASSEQRELATSTTAVGPHRDDLGLLINCVDMRAYASRGQARTMALSLRLAEAAYLEKVRGDAPIVLLDDVLSEMDSTRRRRVLQQVTRFQQILVTTTDVEQAGEFFGPSAQFFRVDSGEVGRVSQHETASAIRNMGQN